MGIQEAMSALGDHRDLSSDEAAAAMRDIMSGRATGDEVERFAAAQDVNTGHEDVDARDVEGNSGAAGGREDAAPVGVAARERGLH